MKQEKPVIASYGIQQLQRLQKIFQHNTVEIYDILSPEWNDQVANKVFSSQTIIISTEQAKPILLRKFKSQNILVAGTPAEMKVLIEQVKEKLKAPGFEATEEKVIEQAIKVDDIIISKRYNPSIVDVGAWINPMQLDLIKMLLGKGTQISILDDQGKEIRKLGT